jgi:septal ring factor EnvC (AmiA/AmiB activator)
MNTTKGLRLQINTKEKRIDTLSKYIRKIRDKNEKLEKKLKKCKNESSETGGDSSSPIETLKQIWKWLSQIGE